MTINPRLTRLLLTSHITFSVGWLGAVAVFLALAIAGVNSSDMQLARSAYIAMELSAWFVIVPFCLASLGTGLIQSLATKWGLFRHYWIIVKLFLTIAATILLLLHLKPIGYMAGLAADASFTAAQEQGLRVQLIADAGAALLLLIAITTISIYKPWGKVKKKVNTGAVEKLAVSGSKRPAGFYVIVAIIVVIVAVIVMHLAGDGMRMH